MTACTEQRRQERKRRPPRRTTAERKRASREPPSGPTRAEGHGGNNLAAGHPGAGISHSMVPGGARSATQRAAYGKKERTPPGLPDGVQESAMTYFPSEKYHRQRRLNCCVRDGNRCFPSLMYTDNPTRRPFGRHAGWAAEAANRNERISTPLEGGGTEVQAAVMQRRRLFQANDQPASRNATTHGWWSSFDR